MSKASNKAYDNNFQIYDLNDVHLKELEEARPDIVKLIRPPVFPAPSGFRSIYLSGSLIRFANLKYRNVDPWLRSLPPSKSPQFNSTAAAVLAFHQGNRDKLLGILAKDSEPFVDTLVAWLIRLAPAMDITREAERRGASTARIEEIGKAVQRLKKFPEQVEQSLAPDHYYCEPGVEPCHDESSCVELLYAGAITTGSCPSRTIFAANHCAHDVACTACSPGKSGETQCAEIYARQRGSGQQSGGWPGACAWTTPPIVKCTAVSDPPSCRAS